MGTGATVEASCVVKDEAIKNGAGVGVGVGGCRCGGGGGVGGRLWLITFSLGDATLRPADTGCSIGSDCCCA